MAQRALAYGVASAGLITTLTAMAALHPYEHVYFNALVDTKTPGALAKRYDMEYWHIAQRQLLERMLARYPDNALRIHPKTRHTPILPQNDRERIAQAPPHEADFYLSMSLNRGDAAETPAIHSVRAYGSVIAYTLDPGSRAYRDYYRAIETNATLLARADFDVYIHDGALLYIKENCEPLFTNPNANIKIFLHIFPADPADLPAARRDIGFENWDFWLDGEPVFFLDGKCIHRQPRLPNYPIARIRTGQHVKDKIIWSAEFPIAR